MLSPRSSDATQFTHTPVPLCVSGVRMISLSYSRISLADIAQKLQLDSPEDAEFIVAKVTKASAVNYRLHTRVSDGVTQWFLDKNERVVFRRSVTVLLRQASTTRKVSSSQRRPWTSTAPENHSWLFTKGSPSAWTSTTCL